MKINKRLTSLFIAAVMLCLSLPIYAYDIDGYSDEDLLEYAQRVEMFGNLGVFQVSKEADDVVTRAEFAHMLRGFFKLEYGGEQIPLYTDIKGEKYLEDIVCATTNGLMVSSNEELFYPNDPITSRDLSRGIVGALGYKKAVENQYKDKEDGFVAMARDIKLFKGTVSKDVSYAITYAEALKVFENALTIRLMETFYDSKGQSSFISDDTVLSETLKCEERFGVVTATSISDLYTGTELSEGNIAIDDVVYKSKIDNPDLLGYRVRYYIDDDENVLYVGKDYDKNSEIVVDCKNILYYDMPTRKYTFDKSVSGKNSIVLPSGCAIIYNGRSNSNSNQLSFNMQPQNGFIKLIDNDNNGKYDVVFIEDYKSIIVGSVDTLTNTIYDKFNNTLSVSIDDIEDKFVSITTVEGKQTDFKNIKAGNIISVAQSIDNTYTRIIVSSNKTDGVLKNFDEDEVKIDSNIYEVSQDIRTSDGLKIGKKVTVYLDRNNNVVYIELKSENIEVAYLIDANINNKTDTMRIKICNVSGTVEKVDCNEKLYLNDEKKTNHEDALVELCDASGNVVPQLITIVRTDDNLIKRIYTVWTGAQRNCPNERLILNSKITNTAYKYIRANNIFKDYKTALSSNCKIFFIPTELGNNDEYSVLTVSDMSDDQSYGNTTNPFYTYTLGGDAILCNYALTAASLSPKRSSSYGIIKSVKQIYDEEDCVVCDEVTMYYGGETTIRIYEESGINVNSIQPYTASVSNDRFSLTPGDLILYNYSIENGKQKMTNARMIYDYESRKYLAVDPSTTNLDESVFYLANVWKRNAGFVAVSIDCENSQYTNPLPIGSTFDNSAQNYRVENIGAAAIYRADDSGKDIVNVDVSNIVDYGTSSSNYSKMIIMSKLGKATCCYIIN